MPKTNEIRSHIQAVEQTKKITGAMEMVSSNRMKKVMSHIEHNRRYFKIIRQTMRELLTSSLGISHPYLQEHDDGNTTFIVISGDKGMCGTYNSAVLGLAERRLHETPGASLITIGNTAEDYFHSRGRTPDITLLGIAQDPTLTKARNVARQLMEIFESGLSGELRVIYTSFYGETKLRPVEFRLLPIILHDYDDVEGAEPLTEIMYLPSAQEVFDLLVPQYLIGLIFGVMVQAYASEHYSRMNAMRSATNNAQEMLQNLRTEYNLARQSAITNEIAEITGAAEILRSAGIEYAEEELVPRGYTADGLEQFVHKA